MALADGGLTGKKFGIREVGGVGGKHEEGRVMQAVAAPAQEQPDWPSAEHDAGNKSWSDGTSSEGLDALRPPPPLHSLGCRPAVPPPGPARR